ncbi:MAG: hypothetical protein PW734_04195 [Verrucomicrobium sp.]|nr:hypothetical protein [Verrucomicrobium sp.]
MRPRLLFLGSALALVGVLACLWLPEGPSKKEIFVPLAKAADFERGCLSVHGPVWWTPFYLQGQSWAGFWSTPLSVAWLEAGRLLFHPWGPLVGYKMAALLALLAAGAAMYAFVEELAGSAWTAAAAGFFYLLAPETCLALGENEHLAFGGAGLCFAMLPLACRGLLRLRRGAEEKVFPGGRLAVALPVGAFFLLATKMAVLSLPLLGLYALWLRGDLRDAYARHRFTWAALAGLFWGGVLGGLPLLPLLREEPWMTLFSTDPLLQWQSVFTLKTPFSWLDRGGDLLLHAPPTMQFSGKAFYVGLLWAAALAGAFLARGPWRGWLATPAGRQCRLFTALALGFAWLSYGFLSPWMGQRVLLQAGTLMPGWAMPVLWAALLLQAALVYRLAAFWLAGRAHRLLATLVFVFVSGFAALQMIPPFGQVRAPSAFWMLNGTFCVAVAGALALRAAVARLTPLPDPRRRARVRAAILAAVVALLWLDFSPYLAAFSRQGLPEPVWRDFQEAAAFLKAQPWGYVQSISGRYFDLLLPQWANKPLTCEAATSYFQPRWIRPYQNLARDNGDAFDTMLPASGVGYVLVDRLDPIFDPSLFAYLKQRRPTLFENAGFTVFGSPRSIAPALATGRVVSLPPRAPMGRALGEIGQDRWPIDRGPGTPPDAPAPAPGSEEGSIRLRPARPRAADYHTVSFSFTPPGQPWVILPESYHPDWKAESDGRPVPVYRAAGCLLAARAAREGAGITFRFTPPWWYNGALLAAALAWVASLLAWLRRTQV